MNFPATHPLYGTGPGAADADVIVVVDDITPFTPGVNGPRENAKTVWIGVDPVNSRYKTMEYEADLWLPVAPVNAARAIYKEATEMLGKSDLTRIAARRSRLETRKRAMLEEEEKLAAIDGAGPHPTGRWVSRQLGRLLDPDAIVVNDGLSNGDFVRTYARRHKFGTYLRTGSSAGGWGTGAAVGAKLAMPDRDVVLASGDGFFMFGSPVAALWAARFHKTPFLSVIFVNGAYSTGTALLKAAYPDGYAARFDNYNGGTFEPPPDFAKIAESVGGYGENVTETADVLPALQRGLKHVRNGVPAIIAVRVPNS
jgi:acetolactate synthase I/II/III large subunit